jgi:signal transduction histidine kinase
MGKFTTMSIRAQLYLMAFIVALPAAGIIVYSGLDQRNNAMIGARTESGKLADNIATEQQSLVAAAKQLLSALAQLPEIKRQDRAKVQLVLSDILKINPELLNIFIVGRNGTMWVSAKPSNATISIADRRHFINARATGQFSSGEYIVGRLLGKPTLGFGYPYRDSKGAFAGVIVANLDLEYSRKLLERSHLPEGSSYLLIDHRGVILKRGIDPVQFVGKRDNPGIFKRMQDGPDSATTVRPGLDGPLRIVSYRKLRLEGENTPYMYIRAGIPVKAALAQANRALLLNLALLTPFMLVAFFIAWLIGKRSIVDPVAALHGASQRLAGGDLETRVSHLVRGGELGELGRALDEMAGALARDINERQMAQEEIGQLNRSLAAHAAELESANRELEAFNYTVSHDLRAPLTNITILTEGILRNSSDSLDENNREYLQRINSEVLRMARLIDTFLDFSNLSFCQMKREELDLSGIARLVAVELKMANPDRRVEFTIMADVTGNADPRLIRVVLGNLIGNAWKYSADREVSSIEFGVTTVDGMQAYFVRDNGVGFAMEDAHLLFGAFQRLHGKEEFEGYGIGLATVQRIIKRHGGTVWAKGEKGNGATFYFTL